MLAMSKYDDIVKVAADASAAAEASEARCVEYVEKLTKGFSDYCNIPEIRMQYFKWKTGDTMPRFSAGTAVPSQAMTFDKQDGFWHLGIALDLFNKRSGPLGFVAFVILVADEAEAVVVKLLSDDKPRAVDLGVPQSYEEFYNLIIELVKQAVSGRGSASKILGFQYQEPTHQEPTEEA
jgi:hypothetical protein